MPIFRVKSVKIYTGQKNLHGYTRGARDKYQVWLCGDGQMDSQTLRKSRLQVGGKMP